LIDCNSYTAASRAKIEPASGAHSRSPYPIRNPATS
jgi:hypothetical protein